MPPRPLITLALTPETPRDAGKLARGLQVMMAEDPTLSVRVDRESGETVISAAGEQHLDIVLDRLKREFDVAASLGRPQIAYRETITCAAEGEMKYAVTAGGRREYAHVKLDLLPGERGSGCVVEHAIVRGTIPDAFIPSIDEGIAQALAGGVLAGYALDDVRVVLVDGSYHDLDSSPGAFTIAGALALRHGAGRAGPVLLEPIMHVEVTAPPEYLHEITDGLLQRGAKIHGAGEQRSGDVLHASVPLAAMFGYAGDLRARTRGRGSFTATLERYEPVASGEDADTSGGIGVRAPLQPRPTPRDARAAEPLDDWGV